jgi:hypothetical protein
MAAEPGYIDISNSPDLTRIAEEVRATKKPKVLRRGDDEVAVISPVKPKRNRKLGKPLAPSDSLFAIIGKAKIADADEVVDNPDKYLADAYSAEFNQPTRK